MVTCPVGQTGIRSTCPPQDVTCPQYIPKILHFHMLSPSSPVCVLYCPKQTLHTTLFAVSSMPRELFWPRSHKRPTPLLSFINILRDLSFLWFATTIIVFIRRSVDISIFKAKFRKRCLSVGHVAFFGFRLCYWSKVGVCALSEPIRMRISLQPVVTHISTSVACVSVINYNTACCVRSIKTWQWFCQCPVSRTCDTLQNIYGPKDGPARSGMLTTSLTCPPMTFTCPGQSGRC